MNNYEFFEESSKKNFKDFLDLFLSKGKFFSSKLKNESLEKDEWLKYFSRWQNLILIVEDLVLHLKDNEWNEDEIVFLDQLYAFISSLSKDFRKNKENKTTFFEKAESSFDVLYKTFFE